MQLTKNVMKILSNFHWENLAVAFFGRSNKSVIKLFESLVNFGKIKAKNFVAQSNQTCKTVNSHFQQ